MTDDIDGWLTGRQVYDRIAERLRAQIASGHYPPAGALPSEAALAQRFHVARSTVRRVLAILKDEGLIDTMPGAGRRVKSTEQQAALYRYQAIAAELRERITTGALEEGTALPSESTLRRQHGASRNTVRHALAELEREGLVVTRRGKGRFVRPEVF
ncbi:GntR family transcriptional regulator [Streptosporangium sp. NPDC000396]|uniref:GntR family transcriptional regulator n=1 Tax=Streptosporangium sp. NPDC000396 TaxID=3366185 RepID=UPI0036AA3912